MLWSLARDAFAGSTGASRGGKSNRVYPGIALAASVGDGAARGVVAVGAVAGGGATVGVAAGVSPAPHAIIPSDTSESASTTKNRDFIRMFFNSLMLFQ